MLERETSIQKDDSGYFPYPYSTSPLPPVLKSGLYAPGLLGLLSVATTLGLLGFIFYRFSTWRKHYRTFVGYNQYVVLCINLLIADFLQGASFLFSFHWIRVDGIMAPTDACSAQGFLLNIGDLSSGFFVMAIALHTFYTAVKGRRVGHTIFMASLACTWGLVLLLSIIGPIQYQGRYFVRAGAWCWAGQQYQTDRLALHYLWIFIVQFGTIVIYVAVLFHLRAAVAAVVPTVRAQSSSYSKVDRAAKLMVLYPLAYIILTLPLSAGRMWSMAHHEKSLPDAYSCVAGALLASSGWVDTLLYTLTRKTLIQGSLQRPRHVKFDNTKSSEGRTDDLSETNGGITQTRTVTVTGQVFAMDTIDEERGRQNKQYRPYDRKGHSPTGSLDPIITGGQLGSGTEALKVGTDVQVTTAPIDFASDDEVSKSSMEPTSRNPSPQPKNGGTVRFQNY